MALDKDKLKDYIKTRVQNDLQRMVALGKIPFPGLETDELIVIWRMKAETIAQDIMMAIDELERGCVENVR